MCVCVCCDGIGVMRGTSRTPSPTFVKVLLECEKRVGAVVLWMVGLLENALD